MEWRENHERDSRIKYVGRKLGLTAAYAAGFLPMAALLGTATASVDDYFGPHEATYDVSISPSTIFDFGPLDEAEAPYSLGPFSADITVHGIPGDSQQDLANFVSSSVDQYALQYKFRDEYANTIAERLEDDALQRTLYYELGWLSVVGVGSLVLKRRVREAATPLYIAGLSTCVLAASLAGLSYEAPEKSQQHSIAGSSNITTDSATLLLVLNRVMPSIQNFITRSETRGNEFAASIAAQLEQHRALLQEREENEVVIASYSDMHCSLAQIKVLRAISDILQQDLTLNDGDATTNGLAVEKECIDRQAEASDATTVLAAGNHDSSESESQANDAGMVVLDGKTVEKEGFDILGDNDPERTPAFGSGADTRFSPTGETEEELGARLYKEALEHPPDILMVHSPDAMEAFLAQGPIPPGVKLGLIGHTHHAEEPETLLDAEGSPVVIQQQGSAGGIGQQRLDSLSTPLSTPTLDATFEIFRWNTEIDKPVLKLVITVSPEVILSVSDWMPLITPDIFQPSIPLIGASPNDKQRQVPRAMHPYR